MDIIDQAVQNTGLIFDDFNEQDLRFGANARVSHNIYLKDKNWLPYYSLGELQHGVFFDTSCCVTFSALNVLEAKFNYMIKNGLISDKSLKWLKKKGYINKNGDFDCADRFNSSLSGTTAKGNIARNVWHSIRNDGVVPETMCSWDAGRTAPYDERFATWFRDPKNVLREAIALGEEFVERFDILYEWLSLDEIDDALHHSPVQVFISTRCEYGDDNVQQRCGYGANHAVSQIDNSDPRGYIPLFDHYIKNPQEDGQERFIRRVATNYKFQWAGYMCNIIEKNMPKKQEEKVEVQKENSVIKILKDKNGSAVGFFVPATSPQALISMAHSFGKDIIRTESGGVAWDDTIEGTYELK